MASERPLTRSEANSVYDVLVQMAGANESDREQFIATQRDGCTEYRFQGRLGFGGKFWNNDNRWYVSCYREDETPETTRVIDETNKVLEILRKDTPHGD